MADNYILKESWGKPNIQSREYVAHDEAEKDAMPAKGGIVVGDKVYVIASKKTYMLGFDNKWYDATEGGGGGDISGKADKVVGAVEGNLPALDSTGNLVDSGIAAADVGVSMVEITHSDLCAAIGNGELVPGTKYRIIDYVTKIKGTSTNEDGSGNTTYFHWGRSIEEPFDIIVTAVAENLLDSNAQAIQHNGDSNYFKDCDLTRWKLHYCPFNDTDQFGWADSENGKGVIYWMKDEWNNEAPYDFKNIQYLMYGLAPADSEAEDPCEEINYSEEKGQLQKYASAAWLDIGKFPDAWNKQFYVGENIWNTEYEPVVDQNYLDTYCADWYFTFDSTWFNSDPQTGIWTKAGQVDTSLDGSSYNNRILSLYHTDGPRIIVFINNDLPMFNNNNIYNSNNIVLSNANNQIEINNNNSFILGSNNKIGQYNSQLYITGSDHSIGIECSDTMIAGRSSNIIIGNYCDSVQLNGCENITIENACNNIRMREVSNTTIEDNCSNITIFDSNKVVIGMESSDINLGSGCNGAILGIGCQNIYLAQNCANIQFGNFCREIDLVNTQDVNPPEGIANIQGCIFDNTAMGIVLDSNFIPENPEYRGGYHIHSGTYYNGDPRDGEPSFVEITESTDRTYPIEIGLNSQGEIVKWIAAEGSSGTSMILTTYADLYDAADTGNLIPGMNYCITDYTTIINGTYYDETYGRYFHFAKSVEHPFNIIVTALDEYSLSENASACRNIDDNGYFEGYNLAAWQLKYTIYNNNNMYSWVDGRDSKGVIYWMRDEFGNEAPYDFKNIQFLSYGLTAADGENYDSFCYDGETNTFKYGSIYYLAKAIERFIEVGYYENPFPASWNKDFYVGSNMIFTMDYSEVNNEYLEEFAADWHFTFDYIDNGIHQDYSLIGCKNNKLKSSLDINPIITGENSKIGLGSNIFFCITDSKIENNAVEEKSMGNILNGSYNILEFNSVGNILGHNSSNNKIGMTCKEILLGNENNYNAFNNSCANIVFKDYCCYNTFGSSCDNIMFDTYTQYSTCMDQVQNFETHNNYASDPCGLIQVTPSDYNSNSNNSVINRSIMDLTGLAPYYISINYRRQLIYETMGGIIIRLPEPPE